MKIKIYENGVLKEEFTEDGFICCLNCGDINLINIGEGYFSHCHTREISVGGEKNRIKITASPNLADVMEILKRFRGMKLVTVEKGNAMLEMEV